MTAQSNGGKLSRDGSEPLDLSEMLTLRETARRLGASYDMVWYLVSEGELAGHRLGGQWCVAKRDVEELLNELAAERGHT